MLRNPVNLILFRDSIIIITIFFLVTSLHGLKNIIHDIIL